MSRCFPYPPPGYSSVKRDTNVALIESIKGSSGASKLQRERTKAKEERKKERKEKKEKKREKEATAKRNNECGRGEKRKRDDERTQKWEKERVELKGKCIQKTGVDEIEQLERSGITEEHELPVCSQTSCHSSDSTQNSNKRRQESSPGNVIRTHGNILRIRLPSHKHKDSGALISEERLLSTSGRTDSTCQHNSEIGHGRLQDKFCSTSTQGVTPVPDKEQGCSTSGAIEVIGQANVQTVGVAVSTRLVNKIQKVESLYKDLIENWVPPLLQCEQTDDDQDWLFQRKNQVRERSKASCNVMATGSSTLWPCAQHLPEVDIYALPFTVPF